MFKDLGTSLNANIDEAYGLKDNVNSSEDRDTLLISYITFKDKMLLITLHRVNFLNYRVKIVYNYFNWAALCRRVFLSVIIPDSGTYNLTQFNW